MTFFARLEEEVLHFLTGRREVNTSDFRGSLKYAEDSCSLKAQFMFTFKEFSLVVTAQVHRNISNGIQGLITKFFFFFELTSN